MCSDIRRRRVLAVVSGFLFAVSSTLYGESRAVGEADVDALVRQLRELPAPMPVYFGGISAEGRVPPMHPDDQTRWQLYNKLNELDGDSVLALARALHDPDVRLRRNVTIALGSLAEGSPRLSSGPARLDIRAALPALTAALKDRDELVRAWAAEDIAVIGPDAAVAVPALTKLLSRDEPARGSACVGLRGIGPAARSALPALKLLLSDPDDHVRKMATWAVAAIQDQ
jgi:HEAT repeat protein